MSNYNPFAPAARFPAGYSANRNVTVEWNGDRMSQTYTSANPGPPDTERFIDYWNDHNKDRHRPYMAAAAAYYQSPPVYGTSAPMAKGRKKMLAQAADLAQDRLNNMNPAYYSNLKGTNIIGNCCEYRILPEQAEKDAGTLRTLFSEARAFSDKKTCAFCETCSSFAYQLVQLNPGLRIVDTADNNFIYESDFTAQCFEAQQVNTSSYKIQLMLQQEMYRLKKAIELTGVQQAQGIQYEF
ncbi:hypothetical protein C8R43DRAFT_951337 [Mycena crocata]|nr:hypothetical protein C8R43DRAFT_951337 [Mycena crocata]